MSDTPRRLRYRDPDRIWTEAVVVAEDGDEPIPGAAGLVARRMKLEAPDRVWNALQVRPVPYGPRGLATGYELLDSEVLAGLRLYRAADRSFPPEVSEFIGDDADSAEPFALLDSYQGNPIAETAGKLLVSDHRNFQLSLLTGVRWLGAAGIAHRGLNPYTVRWDGTRVQITGFTHATVLGAPRTAVAGLPWCAPEQRPGRAEGDVTDRDDLWAVGQLIYYAVTGAQLTDRDELAANPELARLLAGIFGPPEDRPSATELFTRLGATDPVRHDPGGSAAFVEGRAEFREVRYRKHPETRPKEHDEDDAEVAQPEPAPPPRIIVVMRRPPYYVGSAVIALVALAVAILLIGR